MLSRFKNPKFKWDLVVRMIHWSIVTLFVFNQFILDGENLFHEYFGYTIVILIAIRILWPFTPFADESTKLVQLKPSLLKIKKHISEISHEEIVNSKGHNPLGSLMVIAIWLGLGLAALSGYISTTDFGINYDFGEVHELIVDLLLYLVIIHITAVIVLSFIYKVNLIHTINFSIRSFFNKKSKRD